MEAIESIKALINFRRLLHQYPELSGYEENTAKRIIEFVSSFEPSKIITNLGGYGVAAVYEFSNDGSTILIRCELDALPIHEKNTFKYRSRFSNIAHKCGHDGHMAILCGVAQRLHKRPFHTGKVILLFQPAEENGQGAKAVLRDPKFEEIKPDFVFALHNLPGYPIHSVFLLNGQFTPTVQSLSIKLKGKTAHAAEPENGINPALAISELIHEFKKLEITDPSNKNFTLLTPVHILMGQKDYGISAGNGELHFTLRCWLDENMEALVAECYQLLDRICEKYSLSYETAWFDYFPAVKNHKRAVRAIEKTVQNLYLQKISPEYGCKFGEDFGFFTHEFEGAMFGLGAGKNMPALHNDDYDFPDELIETGIKLFWGILEEFLGSNLSQSDD